MDTFGAWLRQQRDQMKLTREQFAERVGCSVALLRKIEDGERRPSAQIAELMANCLNIPPEKRSTFVRVARGELNLERLSPGVKPPATASAPPLRVNLPVLPTPLIGRQREVEELSQLLRDSHCRLLTLVGAGGIGKTRLAIETAAHLQADYANGVYFVPLASVSAARFIVPVIADAIGFAFQSSGPAEPKTQLFSYLEEKQTLLLIDNLEQLLTEPGIEVLAELLANTSQVKLLATSRESLELQDEWVFEVHGLPIPDSTYAEGSAQNTSVELFLQRARRAHVGFTAVPEDYAAIVRICHLMDGMPLGIELAAAWVRTLSCDEIAQEIERGLDFLSTSARDLPIRHRSMRAVFDHSWRLLSAEEQAVLARLSVFRGDTQREAAEAVAGASLPLLSALLAKSFLRRMPSGRYELHELVRQYAADRLHENPEEEAVVRNRHSDYYLALLEQCKRDLQASRQREAIDELTLDIDNLLHAWEHAAERGAVSRLQQVAWPMFWYFELRNLLAEGESAFRQAGHGAQTEALGPSNRAAAEIALAHLQAYQAHFIHRQSRNAEAAQMLEQSLRVLRRGADRAALADALWIYGTECWMVGELERACRILGDALLVELVLKRPWPLADGHTTIGYVEFERGHYAKSERWLRRGLALSRRLGDPTLTAFAIAGLCRVLERSGQLPEMEVLLREGYRLAKESGNTLSLGLSLEQLAGIAETRGDMPEAGRLCQESLILYRETGDKWSLSRALAQLGNLQLAGGAEAEAWQSFVEALEIAFRGNYHTNMLDALNGIAAVEARKGLAAHALELAMRILADSWASNAAKARAEKVRAVLEAQLTRPQVEAAYTRAQARTIEAVVDEVLKRAEFT